MALLDLNQIAEIAGARLEGKPADDSACIDHAASLHTAGPGAISFYSHPRHRAALTHTQASVVLLREADLSACPVPALVCDDPYLSMAHAMRALYPVPQIKQYIHSTAQISARAEVENPVQIGPYCMIGDGVRIGKNTVFGPHCMIDANSAVGEGCYLHGRISLLAGTQLGDRVEIWPGSIIGSDGFGYAQEDGRWIKLRHLGSVRIGDDCEIGALVTIDRGMLEDTVIGCGVKLDNQVQVAHNVSIGDHSAIAGCSGIAGSATIGRYCQIGGGAGVQDHVELADGVVITGMSKADRSIKDAGTYSSGTSIQENAVWLRNAARFKNLNEIVGALIKGDSGGSQG